MATITEDYCSYEIAKLLKEKGFDGLCYCHEFTDYEGNFTIYYTEYPENWNQSEPCMSIPTLGMAMKWLREVHNIGIFPSTYTITNSKGSKEEHVYGSAIVNLITFDLMCDDIIPRNSYEQAAESAIKYSLENLI